jgi:hypothetical protein
MYADSEAEAGAVARFRVVADPGSQVLGYELRLAE